MKAFRAVLLLAVCWLLIVATAAADPPGPGHRGSDPPATWAATAAPDGAKLKHTRLLGHADPGGGFNADVFLFGRTAYLASWGTSAPEGFAPDAFCPSQGVRAYSMRDPRHPQRLSTFADAATEPDLAGTWTEKVIVRRVRTEQFQGVVAAVSVQNCVEDAFRGFALYDVTDPASPHRLALYETPDAGGSHEIAFKQVGDHAYVYTAVILSELTTSPDFDPEAFAADTPGEPDFRIIDASDPRDPVQVGAWGAWAELDVYPLAGQGTEPANFVHSVIINRSGTKAFLSYWDLGTVILDIAEPGDPRFIGRTRFAGDEEGNAHSAWLGKNERLLIQTDEDFDPAPSPGVEQAWGYPRFYDIQDPSNPVELSTFKLPSTTAFPPPFPGFFSVHDPKVQSNLAYFSWYSEGVVIVDISDARQPRKVAQFVPPPSPDPRGLFDLELGTPENPHPAFPFVWGVYVSGRTIVASDINSGLWIFRLDRHRHHAH
jgi:hypothetical protein